MSSSGLFGSKTQTHSGQHVRGLGAGGEHRAPWAAQASASPHSLLPVSSASYSPSQLRGVTISGNKEGQGPVGQLPQLQNSGGLSSISWPGFLAWIWT